MIAKLRGIIDTIGDDYCIVDVNGVGDLVFASAKTLGKLTRGKQYCLLTETVVREDSISLFGFYFGAVTVPTGAGRGRTG